MNATNPAVHEYTLPAYWASYLINGDASGLSDKEASEVREWVASNGLSFAGFVDCTESFYSSRCDAPNQLAGDRCMFTYFPRKD